MDVSLGNIRIYPDHFQPSASCPTSLHKKKQYTYPSRTDNNTRCFSCLQTERRIEKAKSMLKLLSLRRLTWSSGADYEEKVEINATELAALRSELSDLEEREAHLKAQLENIDELLRSARLTGYLYMRTRWKALPGEPPPLDDSEVDDWLPRFVVLHGPCIFFYLKCTDLSPQDSCLLSDIDGIGPLPSIEKNGEEIRHAFYMSTHHGLRYECSSESKIQVVFKLHENTLGHFLSI
uniref:Uncharacterized protein n=1 Tax=Kalanchoe fedtschenkoi TaxID=63787 RepID=A0A7N0RBE9_KALFE